MKDLIPFGLKDKIIRFIAFNLVPRELRYWIVIRTWSEATTGKYSKTNVATLTYDEAIRRSFNDGEYSNSEAYCDCGNELLQDIESQVYETGTQTNIICSQCELQTDWNLDAPVPLRLASHPKPKLETMAGQANNKLK